MVSTSPSGGIVADHRDAGKPRNQAFQGIKPVMGLTAGAAAGSGTVTDRTTGAILALLAPPEFPHLTQHRAIMPIILGGE